MGREYKIALIGTILTLISFIIIGIVLVIASAASNSTTSLLGIAYVSLAQIPLPIIGTLPLLPYETILAMALTDVSVRSSVTSAYLVLGIIGSLPFAVGGVMTGYGFYGLHKQEESTLSLITSILMMVGFGALAVIVPLGLLPQTEIAPWTFLINNYFSVLVPLTQTTIGRGFGIAVALTVLIFVVDYILLGATEIVIREKTPKRDLMISAGILTILGAILPVIGFALLFVAYVLLAAVFNEFRK
ncbi:MAG: hypothetical protein WED07_13600 [Candidatus Freyarchaeum deiterrae]